MALLFAVPRLFLISRREANRPRLARTPPELLPPGGVHCFPAKAGAPVLCAGEWADSAGSLTAMFSAAVRSMKEVGMN